MENKTVNIPGYENIEAQKVADILDSIHEIGEELTYLDTLKNEDMNDDRFYHLLLGIDMAKNRAIEDIKELMMVIRKSRTPGTNGQRPFRSFSKYFRTFATKL